MFDPAVSFPFGIGPHACIGAQLAMTEAVLVLARRLADKRWRRILPIEVLSTRPDRSPGFLVGRW